MNIFVSHNPFPVAALEMAHRVLIRSWMDGIGFDRYENPFEQKWTWQDKFNFPQPVEDLIRNMEEYLLDAAAGLVPENCTLAIDQSRHYTGAFVYEHGDFLNVHVDAGVHPDTGWRKAVTALVYLNEGAPLEFWQGDSCMAEDPQLHEPMMVLKPYVGTVVLFVNDDYAWHGVPMQEADGQRTLLTVSFLARTLPVEEGFANTRERAFFLPRPGEEWSEKMYAIRDRRADAERYAEAYRSGISE